MKTQYGTSYGGVLDAQTLDQELIIMDNKTEIMQLSPWTISFPQFSKGDATTKRVLQQFIKKTVVATTPEKG